MKHHRAAAFSLFLILSIRPIGLSAETTVVSAMDWATGTFRITASMPLDGGMAPDDHPRALEALERDLPPLVVGEFNRLSWDYQGTLGDYMRRNPAARTPVEGLAGALEREWSRLSADDTAVEAVYTLNLGDALPQVFPPVRIPAEPAVPIGWQPVPIDDWTGIVIYVPDGLPVRGTGLYADAPPALRARVLSDDLEVLADPFTDGNGMLSYRSMEDRDAAEPLVGRRPYRTMARGLYGENPCDIILSKEAGLDILASPSGRRALAEGRIVILMDGRTD